MLLHKRIDASRPSWHKFKNSITVEIKLLHSKPNMDNHFLNHITEVTCCAARSFIQQDGTDASLCSGIVLKNDDISVQ
jgi:hypothetical protein